MANVFNSKMFIINHNMMISTAVSFQSGTIDELIVSSEVSSLINLMKRFFGIYLDLWQLMFVLNF